MGDCPSLATILSIVRRWLLMMVLSLVFILLMILKLYQLSYNFVYSYDQFNGDIVIKDIAIWVNKDILYMNCFLWIIRNSFLSNLGWTNICLLSVVSYIQIFNIPSVATKNHIDVIHFKFVYFSPSHFHKFFCFLVQSFLFCSVTFFCIISLSLYHSCKNLTINFIHLALWFNCVGSCFLIALNHFILS